MSDGPDYSKTICKPIAGICEKGSANAICVGCDPYLCRDAASRVSTEWLLSRGADAVTYHVDRRNVMILETGFMLLMLGGG